LDNLPATPHTLNPVDLLNPNLASLASPTNRCNPLNLPASPKSLNLPTLATPTNVREVEFLYNRIIQGQASLNPHIVDQLKKLTKGACKAFATAIAHHITNGRLLEVAKEEKQKGKRRKGKDCGFARVIGIEVLEQREKEAIDKAISKVWTSEYAKISPDIFTISIAAKKTRSPIKKRALGVVEQRPEKRMRLDCNEEEEEEVRIAMPETQTRSGRTVKRTLKVRN